MCVNAAPAGPHPPAVRAFFGVRECVSKRGLCVAFCVTGPVFRSFPALSVCQHTKIWRSNDDLSDKKRFALYIDSELLDRAAYCAGLDGCKSTCEFIAKAISFY